MKSGEMWDRKEPTTSLENIIEDEGKFVRLLAGKNMGKSRVVSGHMERKFPNKVFLVDLRLHPDLLRGLLKTLFNRQAELSVLMICLKKKILGET